MKINELSHLTHIHPETIRMYRKKGFLSPLKLANGYFEYSIEDFVSLIYLRKLREYNLSLEEADRFEHNLSTEKMIRILDGKEEEIRQAIVDLKIRSHYLNLEKRHISESFTAENKVAVMQSIDEKIDVYDLQHGLSFFEDGSRSFYLISTPTLRIAKDILNDPVSDCTVPVSVGIGSYRYMLKKENISVPRNAVIIPNGVCISQMISLGDLSHISIREIAPMIEHARRLKTPFLSDTTGYLLRIRHDKNGNRIYDFRIRACISINSIVDPEALSTY